MRLYSDQSGMLFLVVLLFFVCTDCCNSDSTTSAYLYD